MDILTTTDKLYLWKYEDEWGYFILNSCFIATEEQLSSILGLKIYLGEVAGRYSEVCVTLEKENFTKLLLSDATIEELKNISFHCGNIDILGAALDYLQYLKTQEEKADLSNPRYG